MVNASLNWASIVGIVLAVGGTMLYFLRTFKPGLARDYDVFFAAVGLLCGGILFFQGWRLDPILQFGQFLLASTTNHCHPSRAWAVANGEVRIVLMIPSPSAAAFAPGLMRT